MPPPVIQPLPLPPGWEEARDPASGHVYFANRATGETSWVRPAPVPQQAYAPPPPPHFIPLSASVGNAVSTSAVESTHTNTFMAYGRSIPSDSSQVVQHPLQMNPLYSSNSILPVPSVLGMIQEEKKALANGSTVKKDSIELEKMSGGKLADLCIASMIQNPDREAYTPIDVAGLPIDACAPTIEQGRLEVRLSALYDALNRSSY